MIRLMSKLQHVSHLNQFQVSYLKVPALYTSPFIYYAFYKQKYQNIIIPRSFTQKINTSFAFKSITWKC